ncbi:MAG TPA: hypothetical protein VGZ73_15425 [Bryobacteraceae bacterium]|nr:hypothetical protein [Bryobacteraceae bacterium]
MMEAAGLFDQERVELIDGEPISKMGKKRPHVNAGTLLFGWLIQVFGIPLVNSEAPIDLRLKTFPQMSLPPI